MRYAVVDVETTGFSPVHDAVVEVGCAVVDDGRIVATWNSLVNPGRSIPRYATLVHGICDQDVLFAPSLSSIARRLNWLCEGSTVVAHNASFDSAFLPMLERERWMCTVKLARRAFPDAPNWRLQTLREYLRIPQEARFGDLTPHRALADAVVTAHVLRRCLDQLKMPVAA